ncbi:MAG: amidohydrolase family protein [Acidobacteriota bacterium]
MTVNDAHCHFFSTPFFAALGRALPDADPAAPETRALETLAWDAPGTATQLGDRWVAELDRHQVARAALIASVPGDAASVGAAVRRHPDRLVGFFMVDPTQPSAPIDAAVAIDHDGLRAICLFPAMHRYALQDDHVRRIFAVAEARPGTAVFVHCGVLSVGVRRKLGLPSPYDIRFGNPLDLHALALAFPTVPIIIPHFGAGLLREALMVADLCPNIVLDTSSSNGWIKYLPGLTLRAVFQQALAVAGPDRLLFGSDSSFFPRGWVKDVYERQAATLDELGAGGDVKAKIFGGNFDRMFPR